MKLARWFSGNLVGFRTVCRHIYPSRAFSETNRQANGLVLGLYEGGILTETGKHLDMKWNGLLTKNLSLSQASGKELEIRVFYGLSELWPRLAIVGLGPSTKDASARSESARKAAAIGVKTLKEIGSKKIALESFGFTEASAEGAILGDFRYDYLKSKKSLLEQQVLIEPYEPEVSESGDNQTWHSGRIFGEAQNFARYLAESPANLMTPTLFYKEVIKAFQEVPSVEVISRNREWVASKEMGAFLAVAQGSDEPLIFLEVHYRGQSSPVDPIVLVGKGITFDSGGISIKPAAGMSLMKGDMTGAAVVIASILGAAKLKLPINLIGLIPLCENMPSGKALKPGDVIRSMSGKTIEIDNTDAEGRLILADALVYAQQLKPKLVLDIATLTGAIDVALGFHYTGVFTSDDQLWNELDRAGRERSDLFWRMPLSEVYGESLKSRIADIANSSSSRSGSACSAAAFLKQFVTHSKWAHLDIAGVMHSSGNQHYQWKGMTGRPARSILQFLCNETSPAS